MSFRSLFWILPLLLACQDMETPLHGAGGASSGGSAGTGGTLSGGSAGAGGTSPDPCALWEAEAGNELDARIPDLAVRRRINEKEEETSLHALRSSCEQPRLLVLRVEPAWCSPCGLRADRTAELLAPFVGNHLAIENLLYVGPDNAPTTEADLLAWKAEHPSLPGTMLRPVEGSTKEASALILHHGTVPLVFLIDARTLRISNVLEAPSDSFLVEQVAASLEEVGGPKISLPPANEPSLYDDRFDEIEWKVIQQMGSPWVPPPDPSNTHADNPAAAKLGDTLFHDTKLAGEAGISCATCHDKNKGFADGLPTANGVATGPINTPTALAALNRWFFWDGRADSLWSQALGPLENPLETAGSRLHIAHRIQEAYADEYEAIFGALPPLQDTIRFPPIGKPGDPSFDGMTQGDQEAIHRLFSNVGKAIAAFERTLKPKKIRLEDYAAGNFDALTPLERDGLQVFVQAGCTNCHHGPALSDGAFHDILMPAHSGDGDRGRIDGVTSLLASLFRMDGPYSDDPKAGAKLKQLVSVPEMLGQIKTPSLRNVALTGPWGHGGRFSTLEDVVKHYGQVVTGKQKPTQTLGERDVALGGFLGGHNKELLAFLNMLGDP